LLNFKECKSENFGAKGLDVAQPGCQAVGKKVKLVLKPLKNAFFSVFVAL
jgi:hypothetical protein